MRAGIDLVTMAKTIEDLPTEIIHQILEYVTPSTIPAVQLVSRQFSTIIQPLLWRHYCQVKYHFWSASRSIEAKYLDEVVKTDWKALYIERYRLECDVDREINSILSSQSGRLEKVQSITARGYDAKDALLRHLNASDDAADVLARRYHSDDILGSMHRREAIQQWADLRDNKPVPWERALGAFDMLTLHDGPGDLDGIAHKLDELISRLRLECPGIEGLSPRRRAVAVASFMRRSGFDGVSDERDYYDMRNSFIGKALFADDHSTLPLISAVIFSALAQRLGLDAHPCGFPFHVHAVVKSGSGMTLDGYARPESFEGELMFVDPHRSEEEITLPEMRQKLLTLHLSNENDSVLVPSVPADMVRRTSRNIITAIQRLSRPPPYRTVDISESGDMDSAFYGALWALLILPEGDLVSRAEQLRRYVPYIMQNVELKYPWDLGLVEEFLLPSLVGTDLHGTVRETVRTIRAGDAMPKQPKHRTTTENRVYFKVGQVFQHRRYSYTAVIIGWDAECLAGEEWISHMNVDSLSKGRYQSFYHVL